MTSNSLPVGGGGAMAAEDGSPAAVLGQASGSVLLHLLQLLTRSPPFIQTHFLNASPVWFSHPPTLCFCPVHSLNCPSVQTFLLRFILRAFQKPISAQEPPWIKGKYSYFPPIFPPIHPYLAQDPPAHGVGITPGLV